MIKINLLPQRKVKRPQAEPGSQQFLIGVLALIGAGFAVWFFVDRGKRAELNELKDNSQQLQTQIAARAPDLVGYDEMKTAVDEAGKRASSINRLIAAKVVPANVLHELGEILTTGHPVAMTPEMNKLTGPTQEGDPNKRFQQDWDATHVWLSQFTDDKGDFKLEGGAQSESDMTQLSKRLAASVYFIDVVPRTGERVIDQATGITYYKFTITGKVAY
jgi:hypothetical protein